MNKRFRFSSHPDPFSYLRKNKSHGYESETLTWIRNIQANGGTISLKSIWANDQYIKDVKRKGLFSSILYRITYSGDSLTAARCPLIKVYGSSIATNHNFVSGDYNKNVGLSGNIANSAYLDTGFNGTNLANDNSYGLHSFVLNPPENLNGLDNVMLGLTSAAPQYTQTWALDMYYGTHVWGGFLGGTVFDNGDSATRAPGFVSISRTANNDMRVYLNGTQVGTTATTVSTPDSSLVDEPFFIFCGNGITNGAWGFDSNTHQSDTITLGLTPSQIADLYTCEADFQTRMGRYKNRETQTWLDNIVAQNGTVSTTVISAVDKLFTNLKTHGLFIRAGHTSNIVQHLSVNVGDDSASLCPIIYEIGSSVMTKNGTAGGWTYSQTAGRAGNGTDNYLSVGFNANQIGASNSYSMTIVLDRQMAQVGTRCPMGVVDAGAAQIFRLRHNDGDPAGYVFGILGGTTIITGFVAQAKDVLTFTRRANNDAESYNNGVSQNTVTTVTTSTPSSDECVYHARNFAGTVGSFDNTPHLIECVGMGMTDAQAASLATDLRTFNSDIGR